MKKEKDIVTGKWELWRRLLLLFFCALAAWFYMYASTSPLLRVHDAQMERRQERETSGHFVTERQRHLAALPLDEYAEAIAGGNLITVEGPEWEDFIRKMGAVNQRNVPEEWSKIVDQESLNSRTVTPRLFFDTEKALLRDAWSQTANPQAPFYIKYSESNGLTHYVQATYMTFTHDDFDIGGISGFYNVPPNNLLYPVRPLAYAFLALGIFIYLKLPKPRHYSDAMVYTPWKNVIIDVMGVILFTMFFAMPFFIAGGAVQSMVIMAPLVIAFWFMAAITSSLVYISAWNASFSMEVEDNQLTISNYRGGYQLNYQEIDFIQPAEKRYPGWFKLLMLFAMLGSKGSMKPVMAAHWLNSAGVQSQGFRLHMKNGEKMDFWLMDQMGNQVFSGVEKLVNSLSNAEIPWTEEVVTDQSFTHIPGGAGFWDKKPVFIPYAVLSLLFLLVMLGSAAISEAQMASAIPDSGTLHTTESTVIYPEFAGMPLDTMEMDWISYFGAEGVERGVNTRLLPEEAGYVISGVSNTGNFTRPAQYLVVTDRQGNLVWEGQYPTPGQDSFNQRMVITQEGSFLLTGSEGDYRGRNAFLRKISAEGDELWHRKYEYEENSSGVDLWQHPEGDILMLMNKGGQGVLLRVDRLGNPIWEKALGDSDTIISPNRMLVMENENVLIGGSAAQTNDNFWLASLMMLDQDGNTRWQREFGGSGDDGILAAALLKDGSMAFTGLTHADSGLFRSVFLLITDLEGEVLLEKSYHLPDNHGTGIAITELADGNLAILANVNSDSTTHDFSMVAILDRQGDVLSAQRLEAGGGLRGSDMILAPDGSLLITGMARQPEGLGSSSDAFLLKTTN